MLTDLRADTDGDYSWAKCLLPLHHLEKRPKAFLNFFTTLAKPSTIPNVVVKRPDVMSKILWYD